MKKSFVMILSFPPDCKGPDIEMLDQSLSVSHFAGGYGSTQTGSNLESTRVDLSGEDEH